MFIVRIFFVGLIAFSHNDTNPSPGVIEADRIKAYLVTEDTPTHTPFLLYKPSQLQSGPCSALASLNMGLFPSGDYSITGLQACILENGEQISTEGSQDPLTAQLTGCRGLPNDNPSSPQYKKLFCWVPRMFSISHNHEVSEILSDLSGEVSASATFKKGALSSFLFATIGNSAGEQRLPALKRIGPNDTQPVLGWAQAVAEIAVLELTIPEDAEAAIQINGNRYVLQSDGTKCGGASAVECVDLVLGNLPSLEIQTQGNAALHFLRYYDLSKPSVDYERRYIPFWAPGHPDEDPMDLNPSEIPQILMKIYAGAKSTQSLFFAFERPICPQSSFYEQ